MSANRELLAGIARRITPLLDELVFVGGATAELYFTVPLSTRVRPTLDADAICEATGYVAYAALGAQLRSLGFIQSPSEGDPPFRWRADVGMLDVMPIDPDVLGFSNPWYPYGIATAVPFDLAEDLRIRILNPPTFLATKLAAYEGRGRSDPYTSHDLEDIVTFLARRAEAADEVAEEDQEMRRWIGARMRAFLLQENAEELLLANLPEAVRFPRLLPLVLERIRALARLAE